MLDERLDSIDILDAIDYAVSATKEQLEDLATLQLSKGLDMEGNDLGSYSEDYGLKVKGRLRPVDLKLTGQFHKSMDAKSKRGIITMDNTDPDLDKGNGLERKYGKDIIGLPKDKVDSGEVGEILLYFINERVLQQLNGS